MSIFAWIVYAATLYFAALVGYEINEYHSEARPMRAMAATIIAIGIFVYLNTVMA